ncbi:MAG: FAD-binding protein [Xanthomonadales bacterium]|nr:FAD-binding protein [Xanthomonadales bacterium]
MADPKILIVAENDGNSLNPGAAKSVAGARQIGSDITMVVFVDGNDAIAEEAARLDGVTRVLKVPCPAEQARLAATVAPQIEALAEQGFTHLLAASSTFGRDVMPRVAARLGVAQVSDIMAVEGPYTFHRPIYAGNAIVQVDAPEDQVLVGTIRLASFRPVGEGDPASIEEFDVNADLPDHTRFVGEEASGGDRPDLQSAPRVVAGGRALGSEEKFALIYDLADTMGGAVGATRAAVDAGYVPNELQVGQTGKIIAPELYFAIGISGAIQHLTGIKDAGTIVAINKDPDAPIFEVADIGLVGDLFDIIPELKEKFQAL